MTTSNTTSKKKPNTTSCLGCTRRAVGCHSNCPDYVPNTYEEYNSPENVAKRDTLHYFSERWRQRHGH